MKTTIFKISIVFLLVILMEAGCEKEDTSLIVCGVENPLTNLQWLGDLKVGLDGDSDVNSAEIILYQLDNVDYIYVHKVIGSSNDIPNTIFDCEGNEKFQCGGNQSANDCSTFFSEAQRITTIWEKQ